MPAKWFFGGLDAGRRVFFEALDKVVPLGIPSLCLRDGDLFAVSFAKLRPSRRPDGEQARGHGIQTDLQKV
jgi:hypothetical protein